MSNSVYTSRARSAWPLGFVAVAANGTPVCLMKNVDPSNNNAPETPTNANTSEYATVVRSVAIQAYKPGNATVAMVPNTGNIYLMMRATGNNTGNKADTGSMIKVIAAGQEYFYPIDPTGAVALNLYGLFIDSDTNGDGALCTAYGGMNP